MSRDLLLHFVEGPRGKSCTVLNSQRLWNSSERYWNGLGISPVIQYFPSLLCSVLQSLVQALEHFPVPTERNAFEWEHHLNIAISLAIQYLPSPLRSVPQPLVQAVPTERSGTLLDGNTT
jgi:hypothetical protein